MVIPAETINAILANIKDVSLIRKRFLSIQQKEYIVENKNKTNPSMYIFIEPPPFLFQPK